MEEKIINTPIEEFEAFKAVIHGKERDMLYDKASDLVVILNYASGRSLIYKGNKMNELLKLTDEEFENNPEAFMCEAHNSELETSTPAEIFQSIIEE